MPVAVRPLKPCGTAESRRGSVAVPPRAEAQGARRPWEPRARPRVPSLAGPGAGRPQGSEERDGEPVDLIRILLAILLPPEVLQVGPGVRFRLKVLPAPLGCVPGIVRAGRIVARR